MLAVPGDGDALYRLVRTDQRSIESFRSRAQRGRGKLPSGGAIFHMGLSMFSTANAAASRGGKYPSKIYRVTLPHDPDIHVAKTRGVEHYTVWGEPTKLEQAAQDTGQRA